MNLQKVEVGELIPHHDARKSFYGKARIHIEDTKDGKAIILTSHSTDVTWITLRGTKALVVTTYSPTTLRHLKEFLKQYGFKAESKDQILKDYAKVGA